MLLGLVVEEDGEIDKGLATPLAAEEVGVIVEDLVGLEPGLCPEGLPADAAVDLAGEVAGGHDVDLALHADLLLFDDVALSMLEVADEAGHL